MGHTDVNVQHLTPIIALITPLPDSLDILSSMFSVMEMEAFPPTTTFFPPPPPRRSTLLTRSSPLKAVNDGRVTGRYVRKRAVIGDDLATGREPPLAGFIRWNYGAINPS